jgi:phosphoenolpyruvate carboxykinase (ATP)
MPIQATRTMLRAALGGRLDTVEFREDELFGLAVPLHVQGVDDDLLDPRSTWRDPERYDVKARELAELFAANFAKRFGDVDPAIRAAGPRV